MIHTFESLEKREVLAGPQDLLPASAADIESIASGSWNDPTIWTGQLVPGQHDDVFIHSDHAITLDGDSFADTVRIDGQLHWQSDVDATFRVDTILVGMTGTYSDQTTTHQHTVVFTDDGPIDTVWDTTMVSRGLISQGTVIIEGDSKTAFVKAAPPMAGDTSVWLETSVAGWDVGDTILVAGTHRSTHGNHQDELRTITDIDFGRLVRFDSPLVYDHDTPTLSTLGDRAPFRPDVANLSRNIHFTSENTVDPSRAGHTMYMSPATWINYASFDEVGRNDKTQPTTDPDGLGNGLANPRARYTIHFHKQGETNAAHVTGSVVTNSSGWAFVNHDSNVIFRDNVGYANPGAHFVSEVGSEVGLFENNLAVYTPATRTTYKVLNRGTDKGNHEGFGSAGHGHWHQSPHVSVVNNTVAGANQEAFIFHGLSEPSEPVFNQVPFGGRLESFEAYASGTGLSIMWHRPNRPLSEYDVISGVDLWNIAFSGIALRYTRGVEFRDGVIHAELFRPAQDLDLYSNGSGLNRGFEGNGNTSEIRLESLAMDGWVIGVETTSNGKTDISDVTIDASLHAVYIPSPAGNSESKGVGDGSDTEHPQEVTLNQVATLQGNLEFGDVISAIEVDRNFAGHNTPERKFANFTMNHIYMNDGQEVWRPEQQADAVPFPSDRMPSWMHDHYPNYLDRTMAELDAAGLELFAGEVSLTE